MADETENNQTSKEAEAASLAAPRMKVTDFIQQPIVVERLRAVATKQLQPEKVMRLTLTAMNKTPKLRACTIDSVVASMMITTSLGLEPNTPLGHAYLIPYARKYFWKGQWRSVVECQYQIGYKGYLALMARDERVVFTVADAVYQSDEYECAISSEVETGALLRYVKKVDGPRGALKAAFCFTRVVNEHGHKGDLVTNLPAEEIYKFRARSETYKSLSQGKADESAKDRARRLRNLDETPWVKFEGVMAAKSAIKRHPSQFPLAPQIAAAAAIEDAIEQGRFDLAALVDRRGDGNVADPEKVKAMVAGEIDPRTPDEDETPELDTGEENGNGPIEVHDEPTTSQRAQAAMQKPDDAGEQQKPRKKRTGRGAPPSDGPPVQAHDPGPQPEPPTERSEPPKTVPPKPAQGSLIDDDDDQIWGR